MIETTLPANLFDQFSKGIEDFTDHDAENRSILVYIGLITVILFLLFVIFSLICKCIKMANDDTITTTKKTSLMQPQRRRYRAHSLESRQTMLSSVSSSTLLISVHSNRSLTKPSSSSTIRTFQYQKQYSLPIMRV